MSCLLCGSKQNKIKPRTYHYYSCGLSKIYLKGITILRCTSSECSDEEVIVPNIEKLHHVIAQDLASQETKLQPEEIKYLRSFLGFSGIDFANIIGVSQETVSRWEKGSINMKESAERLLRVLVLSNAGPFRNYEELERFATVKRKNSKRRDLQATNKDWSIIAA